MCYPKSPTGLKNQFPHPDMAS
uniref:Uncharacterized protein n=1 Tax=Anguilla anguilla TaxID=7936 RepID=A0A0E9SMW4_ANGAN